jgi:hypothetical protein
MIGFVLQASGSYTPALLVAAGLCVVGALIYTFVVKVEPLRAPEPAAVRG